MQIKYLRLAHLAQLKADIKYNLASYNSNDTPWLEAYFGSESWSLDSKIKVATQLELKLPEGKDLKDIENVRILYSALHSLDIRQATDERLWAYMTHISHWGYMRRRWSVESRLKSFDDESRATASAVSYVRERYFFMPNRDRALVRNGLARLWWYGYSSFDQSRDDPFELTSILLETLDIAQSLLERSFSRNQNVVHAVLRGLKRCRDAKLPYTDREKFREAMRQLNRAGGFTVIDALPERKIEDMVYRVISEEVSMAA